LNRLIFSANRQLCHPAGREIGLANFSDAGNLASNKAVASLP